MADLILHHYATSPFSETIRILSPTMTGDAVTSFSNSRSDHTTLPVLASTQVAMPLSPIQNSLSAFTSTHGT